MATTVPMWKMSIPRPQKIRQTIPIGNIVNTRSSVGAIDPNPIDYIGDLTRRIQNDISSARNAANVDISGILKNIKSGSGWKPPIPDLPRANYSSGRSGSAPTGNVKLTGNVDSWIASAYRALGIRLTPQALAHERYLIQHESSGNPRAINNWDINAKRGTPSKGIAQVIDPTFRRWALPGFVGINPGSGDIWDPVENLVASLRYRKGRYGSYDIGNYKGGY